MNLCNYFIIFGTAKDITDNNQLRAFSFWNYCTSWYLYRLISWNLISAFYNFRKIHFSSGSTDPNSGQKPWYWISILFSWIFIMPLIWYNSMQFYYKLYVNWKKLMAKNMFKNDVPIWLVMRQKWLHFCILLFTYQGFCFKTVLYTNKIGLVYKQSEDLIRGYWD